MPYITRRQAEKLVEKALETHERGFKRWLANTLQDVYVRTVFRIAEIIGVVAGLGALIFAIISINAAQEQTRLAEAALKDQQEASAWQILALPGGGSNGKDFALQRIFDLRYWLTNVTVGCPEPMEYFPYQDLVELSSDTPEARAAFDLEAFRAAEESCRIPISMPNMVFRGPTPVVAPDGTYIPNNAAWIDNVDFRFVDMTNVTFENIYFQNVRFTGSQLGGATFKNVVFDNVYFDDAYASFRLFDEVLVHSMNLSHADFYIDNESPRIWSDKDGMSVDISDANACAHVGELNCIESFYSLFGEDLYFMFDSPPIVYDYSGDIEIKVTCPDQITDFTRLSLDPTPALETHDDFGGDYPDCHSGRYKLKEWLEAHQTDTTH